MALSKPERLTKVELHKHDECKISPEVIMDVCKISYDRAISIEIIEHLIGGQNMEYSLMEVDNSFECYAYCRHDLLSCLQEKKKKFFSLQMQY